jgi:hypothetical protein
VRSGAVQARARRVQRYNSRKVAGAAAQARRAAGAAAAANQPENRELVRHKDIIGNSPACKVWSPELGATDRRKNTSEVHTGRDISFFCRRVSFSQPEKWSQETLVETGILLPEEKKKTPTNGFIPRTLSLDRGHQRKTEQHYSSMEISAVRMTKWLPASGKHCRITGHTPVLF